MEIILKQDIKSLGEKDDIVTVKPGYGRNYLIPQGFGQLATPSAKKVLAENLKQAAFKQDKIKKDAEGIEERLFTAYNRLRKNAKNGLAVVTIQRDSCSGCFNQIPPQRQSDIRQRKKIIVCEHCGRILVDELMALEPEAEQTA